MMEDFIFPTAATHKKLHRLILDKCKCISADILTQNFQCLFNFVCKHFKKMSKSVVYWKASDAQTSNKQQTVFAPNPRPASLSATREKSPLTLPWVQRERSPSEI